MLSLHIGQGELQYLTISLPDRLDDPSRDPKSSTHSTFWIGATIDFAVGGFHGWYRGSCESELFAGDLLELRPQLARLYSFEANQAMFSSGLGDVSFEIKGDGRGNFEAKCNARSDQNCIEFTLRFDQTEIPRMMRELDSIARAYPQLVYDGRAAGRAPIRVDRNKS
jgi:hypothetical protein